MSRRFRGAILVAGLVLVAGLIARTGPMLVLQMLGRARWSIVAIVMLYSAHVWLRALALWRVIIGPTVRFVDVLRVRLTGEAVEVLTFTGPFLAEPAKGLLLTRGGLPAVEAFAAIATEYLLYTTVSAMLALMASLILARDQAVPVVVHHPALAVAAIMTAFIGAVGFAACSGIGLIAPIVRALGRVLGLSRLDRVAETIQPAERVLVSFLHEHPARLAEVLALEAAGHALFIAEIWIVLAALGAAFSATDTLVIEGAGKLIGVAFFFVPGQLGAAEAVYSTLLRTLGLSAAVGLTLALVRRIRSLCVAGAGLVSLTWFDGR